MSGIATLETTRRRCGPDVLQNRDTRSAPLTNIELKQRSFHQDQYIGPTGFRIYVSQNPPKDLPLPLEKVEPLAIGVMRRIVDFVYDNYAADDSSKRQLARGIIDWFEKTLKETNIPEFPEISELNLPKDQLHQQAVLMLLTHYFQGMGENVAGILDKWWQRLARLRARLAARKRMEGAVSKPHEADFKVTPKNAKQERKSPITQHGKSLSQIFREKDRLENGENASVVLRDESVVKQYNEFKYAATEAKAIALLQRQKAPLFPTKPQVQITMRGPRPVVHEPLVKGRTPVALLYDLEKLLKLPTELVQLNPELVELLKQSWVIDYLSTTAAVDLFNGKKTMWKINYMGIMSTEMKSTLAFLEMLSYILPIKYGVANFDIKVDKFGSNARLSLEESGVRKIINLGVIDFDKVALLPQSEDWKRVHQALSKLSCSNVTNCLDNINRQLSTIGIQIRRRPKGGGLSLTKCISIDGRCVEHKSVQGEYDNALDTSFDLMAYKILRQEVSLANLTPHQLIIILYLTLAAEYADAIELGTKTYRERIKTRAWLWESLSDDKISTTARNMLDYLNSRSKELLERRKATARQIVNGADIPEGFFAYAQDILAKS